MPPTPHRIGLVLLFAFALCVAYLRGAEEPSPTPKADHPPSLKPADAVNAFTVADGLDIQLVTAEPDVSQPLSISFDDRGRMWVLQYLQYPIPNGRKPVEVDQYLRTKYDSVPKPPPHGPTGKDRISIYEDRDGDGQVDNIKHFLSNLNLGSGMAIGHGGVFVAQPPYLLFYPDRNEDDIPDSEPEVLLTGFGLEDPHAFANSLTWGPDGWLYGDQGSTCTAKIRGIEFQQGVWRYHPLTKEFELYSEGGGNSWGIDFDRHGNLFAGGNTAEPLVHHVQGAYYVKGFGKHGPLHNPHSYGYFQPVKHHGYLGDSLTGGFVLYQGGAFPAQFNNACIAPNTRHSASRWSTVEKRGSTFATRAAGDFITSIDIWFRPVESTVGPDGALYVADWYDYNISHSSPLNRSKWYLPSRFDGRVWRVAPPELPRLKTDQWNLKQWPSEKLLTLFSHKNDWYRRQARRILAERRDPAIRDQLIKLALASSDEEQALQGLWALSTYEEPISDKLATQLLSSQHEYVRAWTIRLLGDRRQISSPMVERWVELAESDPSVVVRSQLACSAKRLPADQTFAIVQNLMARDEDVDDPHLPLLIWWAIEDKAVNHVDQVVSLFAKPSAWQLPLADQFIVERLARRLLAEGTDPCYAGCAQLLSQSPNQNSSSKIVTGWLAALKGRKLKSVPQPLESGLGKLLEDNKRDLKTIELSLRLGHTASASHIAEILKNESFPTADRAELIGAIGETRMQQVISALLELLSTTKTGELQEALISALGYFDDPEIGNVLLKKYPRLNTGLRSRVVELLTSRKEWSRQLLAAVDQKQIEPKLVSVSLLRQMIQHNDPTISELVQKHWGRIKPATTAEKQGRMSAIKIMLSRGKGDANAGKALFQKTCSVCHKLHGEGKVIGPDLTGAERKNLGRLLQNIVDPSNMVREQYIAHIAITDDGRVLTGLLAESNSETITILDQKNKRTILRRDEIDELQESSTSLMPEGLLKDFTKQQIRDLFAYLQTK